MRNLERTLAGEAQDDARRSAGRAADARLVDILRADNFQGPHYEKVITRLMEYGWLTINKWTGTGEIFGHAHRAGRPVPTHMTPPNWDGDARFEVVTETVIAGLDVFLEHGLIRGKWSPDGGASLATYFVGASVRSFRTVYTRWFRDAQVAQAELGLPSIDLDGAPSAREMPDLRATDPCNAAATHDEIQRVLPHITGTQVRRGLALRALGYTQQQAAAEVGLTEKALEGRIGRIRARLQSNPPEQPDLGEGGAR
ncbi:hypothetical protein AB0H69_43240 [Streptomyces phaeochromogenes]|uniref:hypothetical protein n=1 Tax=Streptomyces phaeochromogenes TaxID=1923 RepID=UPI0033C01AAA